MPTSRQILPPRRGPLRGRARLQIEEVIGMSQKEEVAAAQR
jgi:hypothetical protein